VAKRWSGVGADGLLLRPEALVRRRSGEEQTNRPIGLDPFAPICDDDQWRLVAVAPRRRLVREDCAGDKTPLDPAAIPLLVAPLSPAAQSRR
jgi:hypothetical protein